MDRYVIREARAGSNHPQGNQTTAFSTNATTSNIIPPESIYYGSSYANQFADFSHSSNSSFRDIGNMTASMIGHNVHPVQGQMVTGIDPRFLANYSDNSAQFIVTGQTVPTDMGQALSNPNFGSNYQNRSLVGPAPAEKNRPITFTPHVISNDPYPETPRNMLNVDGRANTVFHSSPMQREKIQKSPVKGISKVSTSNAPKKDSKIVVVSRAERLQALHKSGPRAFSGPVEKVLKWHKALQDIGAFIFYEIVAKCVSIRSGCSCSKILVIRDDNGPAMQVVYYEIDFLLPELKIPSTVRVIGRMLAGTCRLQAFNVRPAIGDDVAMLSRRAAVAAHHVSKLCKEYGITA